MNKLDWPILKKWIKDQAPVTVAGGDIRKIKNDFELNKEQDLSGINYALSLAFPLPGEALSGIHNAPTLLYKHAYSQINYLLDRLALGVSLRLQDAGHRAIPVPASQIIDWEKLTAHLSHRQVAVHLGQGWYGRNNLLVTPSHGARVRLATVLTDAQINDPETWANRKGESGCGECKRCATVCPVSAIHEGPEDFDLPACSKIIREFEKMRGIGHRICGICIRACTTPKVTPL